MNFFQRWNPVYLHKLLKEKEVELTEKDTLIHNLTYEYKLPTDEEIKCGYYLTRDEIVGLLDGNCISSKERKMALDIRVMVQLVEGMELELKRYRESNLENALKHLDKANKEVDYLLSKNDTLQKRISSLEEELKFAYERVDIFKADAQRWLDNNRALSKKLEKSDKLNEKLWVAIFGYGRDEMTLLNKSFWGKDLVAVELPGEEHDNNNA